MIKSLMLYGCETWKLTEKSKGIRNECHVAIYEDFTKRELGMKKIKSYGWR